MSPLRGRALTASFGQTVLIALPDTSSASLAIRGRTID